MNARQALPTRGGYGPLIDALANEDFVDFPRVRLMPDRRYSTTYTTSDELHQQVIQSLHEDLSGLPKDRLPRVIVAWGKCRVGSTVLTSIFARMGMPAYYQPLKTKARWLLVGGAPIPWNLDGGTPSRNVFIKEMSGPYLPAEVTLNPLYCLLGAGYPPDRICLLVLDRDPEAALGSYFRKWSDRRTDDELCYGFVASSLTYPHMRAFAERNGVPVVDYVYELAQAPSEALGALLVALGLTGDFDRSTIEDWAEEKGWGGASVIFPPEPEPYVVATLHDFGSRYEYRPPTPQQLPHVAQEVVLRYDLHRLYRRSLDLSLTALALDTSILVDAQRPDSVAGDDIQ